MTSHIHTHHPADDLLDDYLLGTLADEEIIWIEAHLEQCPQCQAEIESMLAAAQALPFSAPEPDAAMSHELWGRIERSITMPPDASTPAPAVTGSSTTNVRTLPLSTPSRPWALMAALMIVSLISGLVLGQVFPQFGDDEENIQHIAIEFTDPDITATGELRYLPDEGVLVLDVTGLPELPEGQVYQAWLIDGNAPIPVGVVPAGTGEFAATGNPGLFQAFAVTIEQGPLGAPAPTSDPILVAPLENFTES